MDEHDQVTDLLAKARHDFKQFKPYMSRAQIKTAELNLDKAQREIERNRYTFAKSRIRIARRCFD